MGPSLRPYQGVWQPLAGTDVSTSISYLHERAHKRELRLQSARNGDGRGRFAARRPGTQPALQPARRLRPGAAGQSRAGRARDNLAYYDRLLVLSNDRFKAGDIAQVDLDRLELQRVQFETDVETALVNVRTAKIQLLQLLNDRMPVEQFDITGPFEFADVLPPLDEYRNLAIQARPDLKAAMQSVELARTNHQLAVSNGSTDPTFSAWWTAQPLVQQPVRQRKPGHQHHHSTAFLRPQPGREGAHPPGYPP